MLGSWALVNEVFCPIDYLYLSGIIGEIVIALARSQYSLGFVYSQVLPSVRV